MTLEAAQDLISQLHFLRPFWFFGLLPALMLALIFRLRQGKDSAWERSIDPRLLPHLLKANSLNLEEIQFISSRSVGY